MTRAPSDATTGDGSVADQRVGRPAGAEGWRAAAFDRTMASAAIVDAEGRIIEVNAAWRLFGQLNGAAPAGVGEGVDYLAACDRAARHGDRDGAVVAHGLRSVLAGERTHFEHEYQCASPVEDRWFVLEVEGIELPGGSGTTGAVLTHHDVSVERLRQSLLAAGSDRDPATGLLDRHGAIRVARELLAVHRSAGVPSAVIIVHVPALVDPQVVANERDRAGLLLRLAARIRSAASPSHDLALLDPTHLAVLCPGSSGAAAAALARDIERASTTPLQFGSRTVHADLDASWRSTSPVQQAEALLASSCGLTASTGSDGLLVEHQRPAPELAGATGGHVAPDDPFALHMADHDHHRIVVEAISEAVIVHDSGGRILLANRAARDLMDLIDLRTWVPRSGWHVVDATGAPLRGTHPFERAGVGHGDGVRTTVIGLVSELGQRRWIDLATHLVGVEDGSGPLGIVTTARDVTRHREAADQLRAQASCLDAVNEAVVSWDADGVVTYANAAARLLFDWRDRGVLGHRFEEIARADERDPQVLALRDAIAAGRRWDGEITVERVASVPVTVWASVAPLSTEPGTGFVGLASDITERKAAEAVLAHQLTHDLVTGLANRRAMVAAVGGSLGAMGAGQRALTTVASIDLGDLDSVNDLHGQAVGDATVTACAARLAEHLQPDDVLARWSDRSLVVCSGDHGGRDRSVAWVEGLRRSLVAPVAVGDIAIRLRPVAGVAVVGATEDVSAAEALRRADTARLRARGRGGTLAYDEEMDGELRREAWLADLVEEVIELGAVGVAYQPIVRLDDGRTVGAEALLRVAGPDGAAVPAIEVVEAAEARGRIGPLGELVLRTACADARRWRELAPEHDLHVSVNVSPQQLDDPVLVDRVRAALVESGLPPSALWLEVTESALMGDPERSARVLGSLKALGVTLAADDFGTGYSSLSHLKRYPLDVLKVDRSFIEGLPDDLEDVAITRAIVAMADALGMAVVAEGVEQGAQLEAIRELAVSYGQGFFWSRAVDAAAFGERAAAEVAATVDSDQAAPRARPPSQTWRPGPGTGSEEVAAQDIIDEVLHVVAHEVRSPLSVITGYAGLLADSAEPEVSSAAAAIERAGARIDRILDEAVVTGELGGGGREPIEIGAWLERFLDSRPQLAGRVVLERSDACEASVLADRSQLEQVLENLVANALKYGPPDGPVEVGLRVAASWVEVSVADRGAGIAPEHLGTVFRKYGRVDRTRPGTGLGLYVARRIARAHGGEVRYLRRAPGPGSVFVLRLPTR